MESYPVVNSPRAQAHGATRTERRHAGNVALYETTRASLTFTPRARELLTVGSDLEYMYDGDASSEKSRQVDSHCRPHTEHIELVAIFGLTGRQDHCSREAIEAQDNGRMRCQDPRFAIEWCSRVFSKNGKCIELYCHQVDCASCNKNVQAELRCGKNCLICHDGRGDCEKCLQAGRGCSVCCELQKACCICRGKAEAKQSE